MDKKLFELHCLRGDWYLLRTKLFRNDSTFLVREIGRVRGVEERSLLLVAMSKTIIISS